MKWSALLASFGLALPALGALAAWQQTIDEVSSGGAVRIERVRALDTTWYAHSQATGFVVCLE
jgi:hypothetical protein